MEIKTIAIQKALRLLEASGASFHVKFGEQEWGKAIEAKRAKKESKYPRGALAAHIAKYTAGVKPNETVKIPVGEFDINAVRYSTTGYLSAKWGNGSYMVHKEPTYVEVLRLV